MNSRSQNIALSTAVEWNYKHFLLLIPLLPFIYILVKIGDREALAALLTLLFFFLGVELPKVGIGLFFLLLMLDLNPSTYQYDPDSIFTIWLTDTAFLPLHIFYEIGFIGGWLSRRFFTKPEKIKLSPLHLPLILFLAWITISQLRYPFMGGTVQAMFSGFRVLFSFIMFFIMYENLKTIEDIKRILYIIIAGLSFTFIIGYVRFLTNNYYQWGLRLFILWNEQVQMLHLMGMFALLAGLEKKLRFPLFAGIVIYLLCVFQVFLSTSRAVLVGTGATFLFTMLLRFWHRKIAWLGIPLFAIIVVFLLVYLKALMNEMAVKATSITLERLQTMSLQNADLSVLFRLFSYQSALQTALQHPFLGICLNSGYYLEIFGVKYFTTILDNTFLKLALSAGFPSLLFYLVCLFVIYKYSFKTLKKVDSGMDRAVLLSLISVVCMANVVEFFHSNIFFLRVMPMVTFAWAGLMRLKQAYDVK